MIQKLFTAVIFTVLYTSPSFSSNIIEEDSKTVPNTKVIINSMAKKVYQETIKYRNGEMLGFPKDSNESLSKAEELFLELTGIEHTKAMHNLASIYYHKKDYKRAYEWFKKAGDNGFEPSRRNIGRMMRDDSIYAIIKECIPLFNPKDRGPTGFAISGSPDIVTSSSTVKRDEMRLLSSKYKYKASDNYHVSPFSGKLLYQVETKIGGVQDEYDSGAIEVSLGPRPIHPYIPFFPYLDE